LTEFNSRLLVQYPYLKTTYNSILFCQIINKKKIEFLNTTKNPIAFGTPYNVVLLRFKYVN